MTIKLGYTNSDGDYIEVDEQHLKFASDLKKELQMAVPSKKCNWKLHKKVMLDNGYDDSDSNENYRGMINKYLMRMGQLPTNEAYRNVVAESKLEQLKNVVGDLAFAKRENQHILKELNKVQRDVIDGSILIEEITNAIQNMNVDFSKYSYKKIEQQTDDKMFVFLSDLHVGALVHNEHNTYEFSVAKKRMEKYLENVIIQCKTNGITSVSVVGLGDYLEHVYMRNQQGFEAEFTYAVQIVKATELILEFIVKLSEHVNVSYQSIGGNHDRFTNKNDNVPHDNVCHVINNTIKLYINAIKSETLEYVEATNTYYTLLQANGKNILAVHGDRDSKQDKLKIAKYSQILKTPIHAIVVGHYHHYCVEEVGFDEMEIYFGSLKGVDDYSLQIKKLSPSSQGIVIVRENGEIVPMKICLQKY